jgi:hypothetical protein
MNNGIESEMDYEKEPRIDRESKIKYLEEELKKSKQEIDSLTYKLKRVTSKYEQLDIDYDKIYNILTEEQLSRISNN